MECWLHDEDVQLEQSEQLGLEGRLEVSLEVEGVPVVELEAVQNVTLTSQQIEVATRRNVFDLFENLFEECLNVLNQNETIYLVSYW